MKKNLILNLLAIALALHPLCAAAESYAVAWKTDGSNGTTTPEQALTQLQTVGSPLYVAMGSPIDARKLFATAPAPPGSSWSTVAAENQLRQYLVLTFVEQSKGQNRKAELAATNKLGYIGDHSTSATDLTVLPNDEYFSTSEGPPDTVQYAFPYPNLTLLGMNAGWASLGLIDTGPYAAHEDLERAFSKKASFDFQANQPGVFYWSTQVQGAHGTHVAGIMAARANNPRPGESLGRGISGVCPTCIVMSGAAVSPNDRANSARILSGWGAQVINLSGFIRDPFMALQSLPAGTPCSNFSYDPNLGAHPFCAGLKAMRERGSIFVASAGNNKGFVLFPANDPLAVAVAGGRNAATDIPASTDAELYQWNESVEPLDPGDWPNNGCPQLYNQTSSTTTFECGSNTGPEIDFTAPARHVISTFPPGAQYAAGTCSDNNFGQAADGYAWCTGTSMAAPFLTGLFGLMASYNPLLSPSDTISELALLRAGLQDGQLSHVVLGLHAMQTMNAPGVGGWYPPVRLTPMFVTRNTESGAQDRLYSAKPQLAQAALFGEYLAYPTCAPSFGCQYNLAEPSILRPYTADVSNESSLVLAGSYQFPIAAATTNFPTPRSSFYVFTDEFAYFSGAPLTPLHRLSMVASCDKRDTVYTTDPTEISYFESTDFCPGEPGVQSYGYEGIEGFVLSACPSEYSGCTNFADSSAPQPLYRRYSAIENASALILGSQAGQSNFSSYQPFHGHDLMGYVFPNVDSDNDKLIDGYERILGTNRFSAHSDCDGTPDGDEFVLTRASRLNSNPAGGGCG